MLKNRRINEICLCLIIIISLNVLCALADDKPLTSKSVPVQMKLAFAMETTADWEEAARRWIDIMYYFGPSEEDTRSEFEIAAIALRMGKCDIATRLFNDIATDYPDTEWGKTSSDILAILKDNSAECCIALPSHISADIPEDERQFLCAQADAAAGLYDFAIRDHLKVTNLFPLSARAPESRLKIGDYQLFRGKPELAISQWQRVIIDYPDSAQASQAKANISRLHKLFSLCKLEFMSDEMKSAWEPIRQHNNDINQGLSYAEDLFENEVYAYSLQEYAKVLCDIYTKGKMPNPYKAYARYRIGVCAYKLGYPTGALRQWRRLEIEHPDSTWVIAAKETIALLPDLQEAVDPAPALPPQLNNGLLKRMALADQLISCEMPLVASKEYMKVIDVITAGKPNPFQAEALYKLGDCQRKLDLPAQALASWQQVIDNYPQSPWAESAQQARTNLMKCEQTCCKQNVTENR